MFQFTHPRRVRSFPALGTRRNICFNSRTREGCDLCKTCYNGFRQFQFTHPRRVRLKFCHVLIFPLVSIHAPAKGAINRHLQRCRMSRFNSRTREGCDQSVVHLTFPIGFQFTHPRRVRSVKRFILLYF